MSTFTFTLKMDLKEQDLLMFFKPWQLKCLNTLWSNDEGLSSRKVWEPVENEISRASVINFIEEMTVNGLLTKHEITGKGGHRGIYKPVYDEQGTRQYLRKIFTKMLEQI
ncbi:MAG: hypothetical protein ACTSQY_09390 [Candidatus Odinarchaeia archaeon]